MMHGAYNVKKVTNLSHCHRNGRGAVSDVALREWPIVFYTSCPGL